MVIVVLFLMEDSSSDFSGAMALSTGLSNISSLVWLANVQCTGLEESLTDCPGNDSSLGCSTGDAGVVCEQGLCTVTYYMSLLISFFSFP